ncbi:MAG: SGNH/GDSL hydrolase family protein [Rhodospirillales bacterium]|nr:SGNH/GDSL hydrolase family protein [Rhodospirillales bacterium]
MNKPSSNQSRIIRACRIVAVNLGLLLAGALVAELIFGSWVIGENYGTLVIPKNFTRVFDVDSLYGGGRILYKRDEHGLRGRYRSPSEIDILTIGGSTTNEIFIDEDSTWSAIIAREFKATGRPVTVVNAGVDGQSTVGNIKNFELWFPMIPGLKARYVLALLGVNDAAVIKSSDEYFAGPFQKLKQDRMVDLLRPSKQYLINNSALYALFRNVRGMIRARDAKLVHSTKSYDGSEWRAPAAPPNIERKERELKNGLDQYEQRLRELARRIRAFGAEPIYVTQHRPSYRICDGRVLGRVADDGRVDLSEFETLMAVNRRTMAVCRDVKAICIDLAAELFFTDGDHYDQLHTSPKGSEKMGKYLFGKLRSLFIM